MRKTRRRALNSDNSDESQAWEHLGQGLSTIQQNVNVILRDDDVTDRLTTLTPLLEIVAKLQTPLHLAVIPTKITEESAKQINRLYSRHSGLIELGQHGLAHTNYGSEKHPYEFGRRRRADQQYNDIAQGQQLLSELFGNQCASVFTPPYYGYNRHTLQAVDALGFEVFSGGPTRPFARNRYRFCEVSVNIDLIDSYWPQITYKSPKQLTSEILRMASRAGYLGIIIHHDLLPLIKYNMLERLLSVLADAPNVRFHHVSEYARLWGASPRQWNLQLSATQFHLLLPVKQNLGTADLTKLTPIEETACTSELLTPSLCDFCGHEEHHLVVQQRDMVLGGSSLFNMWRCLGCGLLYQYPRALASSMNDDYPAHYPVYTRPIDQENWPRRLARRYGLRKRVKIVTRQVQNGKLLDVGCATGDFLGELRRYPGWTAVGLEPIKFAANATGRAGLPCVCAWANATPFASDSFDVITLWDTLETFTNPREALNELTRLLRSDGIMIINHVNLESLDRQLFGKFWCGYELPRHQHLFPGKLLETLLAEHGMTLVEEGCRYGSYSNTITSLLFMLEGIFGESWQTKTIRRILRSIPCRLLMIPIYILVDQFGRGSNITRVFRKDIEPNSISTN